MSPTSIHHDRFDGLDVAAVTSAMMTAILESSTQAHPALTRGDRCARIEELLRSSTRLAAAIELIARELPRWQLRRLAYDGGEWHCALSRLRDIADWLDQCADGHHTDPALAILNAAMEALRDEASPAERSVPSGTPMAQNELVEPLCCDNFS